MKDSKLKEKIEEIVTDWYAGADPRIVKKEAGWLIDKLYDLFSSQRQSLLEEIVEEIKKEQEVWRIGKRGEVSAFNGGLSKAIKIILSKLKEK